MDNLDSYTERSPGGSGIHILVKADINTYGKSSDEDLEIYDANKYFTFTGEHIHGYPVDIRSRDRQVRALIRNYGPFVY
jgi:primase-polymerase (primpol)-like protein